MAKQKIQNQEKPKQTGNRKGVSRKRTNKNNFRSKEMESSMEGTQKGSKDMPHNTAARCADNDPNWYTHVFPLAQDVASFNYNIPVGTPFNPLQDRTISTGPASVKANKTTTLGKVVPGIFTLQVQPSIGYSNDPISAPNIAAQQLYSLVRKANSGAVNYDKTDLMMMIVAMDSAYMLYEEMLRAYRLIGRYDVDSRYMPDALMYALGFDPSLQRELANFRALLDTFAYKFSAINVPDQFDFIKRHSWLFSNVYADSESSKAQLYAYVPDGYYVWVEGDDGKPSHLKYVARAALYNNTDHVATVDAMYKAMNAIMEPLLGSQDIGTMSGDIAKAFGESGMISIVPAGQYETLTPTYSMEVIQQMMNSSILGSTVFNSDITVGYENLESGPYLKFTPGISKTLTNIAKGLHKHLVNIRQAGGVEINMVATRNICVLDWESNAEGASIVSCGTEIITHAYMYVMPSDGYHITHTLPVKYEFIQEPILPLNGIEAATTINSNQFSELQDTVRAMVYAAAFDNHPSMYLFFRDKWNDTANTITYQGAYQDFDNYTWLDDQTVKQLNDAALISLFYTQSWPNI